MALTALEISNSASVPGLKVTQSSNSDAIQVSNGSSTTASISPGGAVYLKTTATPPSNVAGMYSLYVDSSDNALKIRTDSGTNTSLGTPTGIRGPSIVVASSGGDYTTIQSAIDTLSSGTGGTIYVRAGTYTITTPIAIKSQHTRIIGEGGATKINFDGETCASAFKMNDTTARSNIVIENLQITNTNASYFGIGIDASYFNVSTIKNIWMVNVNKGIEMNGAGCFYNLVEQVRIACGGTTPIGINIAGGANENTVFRTRIIPTSSATGVVVAAHGNSLYDVNVESGAAIGIDIQANGNDCSIFGCYLEGNVVNLKIAADVEALLVSGGTINDGSTYNIQNLGGKGLDFRAVSLQYEQFTFKESRNGMPAKRWQDVYMNAVFGTNQAFGTAGRVWVSEFELQDSAFVDGIAYTVGTTQAGNVRAGIYGPIATEETPVGAALVVESASTQQGATSTSQVVSVTKTLLRAGRYYVGLQGDDTTGTFMRTTGVQQVAGWSAFYDRGGGYGAFTTPCPSVTANVTTLPGLRVRLASLTTV